MIALLARAAPYLIGALVVFGIVGGIHHHGTVGGRAEVQAQWDADKAQRLAATNAAILKRVAENTAAAAKQSADNADITKAKNEDLAPVRARIADAPRLRVGAGTCGGSTARASAENAASGNGENPPGRVVREDIDRDIKALMVEVEEALATGRACQAFGVKNGMVP